MGCVAAAPRLGSPSSALVVGSLVRWYSNGYRYGRLLKTTPKWSKVLYANKVKRIPTSEVEPYA